MLWLCYGPFVISFSFYFRFYNFLNQIKENSEIFHHVFCPSEMFSWTCDIFLKIVKPSFSESGSNKKISKKQFSKVLSTWLNVYSWMVSSFIHKIFSILAPADHQPKSVFHSKPYAEMQSGYKIMHNYYTKPHTSYQQTLKMKI